MSDDGYILRSYHEVWRDQIKEAAGADEVTRLPKRKIGAAVGVYVITGSQHKAAAEYMQEQLEGGISLAEEISLTMRIEEEFQVAIDIEYEGLWKNE